MAEERSSRLASSNIQIKASYLLGKNLKRILKALIMIAMILLIVYSAVLVPTAVRFLYTDEFGLVLTKDPTITMGSIPAGKIEIVAMGSNTDALKDVKSKMIAGFTGHSSTSRVEILAGSTGRLTIDHASGVASIDDKVIKGSRKPMNYSDIAKNKNFLSDQYYVKCLAGSCKQGEYYIISEKDVLGEIKTNDADKPLIDVLEGKR
jgi:hypothetical protein